MEKNRDLFKKIGNNKETFHAKMGTLKDRNDMYLTDVEDVKMRWQEYTELFKKDFNDPDNLIMWALEPDILECDLKWAIGSITANKASGGIGISAELFQILKDDAVKVLHSICQQIGKVSSEHKSRKGQFSFQSQRRSMPKIVQIVTQLHLFNLLAK